MRGCLVLAEDHVIREVADLLSFKEIINFLIGDAERRFVGFQGHQTFQISGRYLVHQFIRRAECLGQGAHAALVQTGQRCDVAGTVAEFGEESHQGFGRMIGADHEAACCAGHRVLSNHALPCLDIAQDEVFLFRVGKRLAARFCSRQHCVTGRLDVDGEHLVRCYRLHGILRILLILLYAIGQTYSDELCFMAALARLADCRLSQASCCG